MDGDAPAEPGVRSLTRTVPASVPSDFHSSRPEATSVAANRTTPFSSVKFAGLPELGEMRMSFNIKVPAVVPSLIQSSWPFTMSVALKNSRPRAARWSCRLETFATPGRMSLTM